MGGDTKAMGTPPSPERALMQQRGVYSVSTGLGGEWAIGSRANNFPCEDLADNRLVSKFSFGRAGWRNDQGLSGLKDGVSAASLGRCSGLALCHYHRPFSDRHM